MSNQGCTENSRLLVIKFIAPGLPNRNLTKEQQRKHRDAERGIRRPPTVENNGSSIFQHIQKI